jgi:uncharacterized protein DUF4062
MPKLRVFVSSTCYDLGILRSELRPFISAMGYEPVMSDYSDVLFDPRTHTHESCLKEVPGSDMVVLIIGSRFGGVAIPSASAILDFEKLRQLSTKSNLLQTAESLSITQLEVLKAVEASIPVYTFVEEKVLGDHLLYEKNKDKKGIIDQIDFPSIQKRETAKYIFEFINFLSHRVTNNGIISFSRLDDIKSHLASQWSQLFQRLLLEGRTKTLEEKQYRDFSDRIEDLKALILASIATPDLRETAKGALQFRRLIGFISALEVPDPRELLLSDLDWDGVLKGARIAQIRVAEIRIEEGDRVRPYALLVLENRTFYRCLINPRLIPQLRIDWSNFLKLESHAREAIVDALLQDSETRRFPLIEYIPTDVDEYLSERQSRTSSQSPMDGEEQGAAANPLSPGTLAEKPDASIVSADLHETGTNTA